VNAFSELFAQAKTIAVVGLSNQPNRPSFGVAATLRGAGFHIIPVNPSYAGSVILGEPCLASLGEISVPVDIVDCFRKSEDMVDIATQAARMIPPPKVLWMQLGVENAEAAKIARTAGIEVVQNQCLETQFLAHRPYAASFVENA
jgi:uncharacterized protein